LRKSPLIEESGPKPFHRVNDGPLVVREDENSSSYRGNVP
jgi:hypothetical protein